MNNNISDEEKDIFIKKELQKDVLISKKFDDTFEEFIKSEKNFDNEDQNEKQNEVVQNDNVKKNIYKFNNKIKSLTSIAAVVLIFIGANVYASANGYGNIFFMIKNLITNQEITGTENLFNDKEITISYSSIEIADGVKIQIQNAVLEKNQAKINIFVNEENIENGKTPLKYKIYDKQNMLIAAQKSKKEDGQYVYTDELKIGKSISEDERLKIEIYDNTDSLLSELTVDLNNRQILVNGNEIVTKQSEVEMKKYLSAFALLNKTDMDETSRAMYTAEIINEQIIQKNEESKRNMINNIIEAYYYESIEKTGDIIKINNHFYNYDKTTDQYIRKFETSKALCLDIKEISYRNKSYTVKFVYCYIEENDENIEEHELYEAIAQIKINENQEYSKYKLINLTKGTVIKEKTEEINNNSKLSESYSASNNNINGIGSESISNTANTYINKSQENTSAISNQIDNNSSENNNALFPIETVKKSLQKYYKLRGAFAGSPENLLIEIGLINSYSNKDSEYISTKILYEDFKNTILQYITDDCYEYRFENWNGYEAFVWRDIYGQKYLEYRNCGGSGEEYEVVNVKQIEGSSYIADVNCVHFDGTKELKKILFNIVSNNKKCVIDMTEVIRDEELIKN
ncbi:MAG: hypothetical protein IJV31_05530 [Clostridia bacterium]|nr:hypothetical protein [Clostridia bacterium]